MRKVRAITAPGPRCRGRQEGRRTTTRVRVDVSVGDLREAEIVDPPFIVENTINEGRTRKTEQFYVAEEYKFRVEREKRESGRKKIEAEGIRDFQQIVSQGISESYLRWRGIEATLQLS